MASRGQAWRGAAVSALTMGVFVPVATQAQTPGSNASQAISAISEVVVTARRREENVQDVPLSVQAFSQESLRKQGVTEIKDLKNAVPGLTIVPGTFRESTPVPYIRGFSGGGLQIDNDPAIPFIINEVPVVTPQGQNAAFFDIENVQVLKGPQGTLQGRNTVGGAVLIATRKPDFGGFGGHVTAKVGNYDLREFEGVLNLPVNDRLALRGAFHRTERDGTWVNIRDGRDYNDKNSWSLRLSARAQITDNLENTTVYDRTWTHEHGTAIVFLAKGFDFNDPSTYPANGQVIPCQTAALCARHNIGAMLVPGYANYIASQAAYQSSLGWGRFDSFATAATSRTGRAPYEHILNWGLSNVTAWDMGGGVRMKNILGYRRVRSDLFEDIDATSAGLSTVAGFANAAVPIQNPHNAVDLQQVSEELQFQGAALDNKAHWVAGLFLSRYFGFDNADALALGARRFNLFKTTAKSLGAYGQFDVKMTDKFTLTGGYRYSWDERRAIFQPIIGIPLLNATYGFFGSFGQDIVAPPITNAAAQCNFNRAATATRPAFAGVDPLTCKFVASLHGSAPSYNITLQYRPSEDIMVYLAHRQGYRAGFLTARATTSENLVNQNELVRDLELGLKSDFRVADIPVRLNAATYYSWYSDIAVAVPKIDPATGAPFSQAENSGSARLYGGEATLDVRPTERLTVNASLGLSYGVYDSFPAQTVTDALGAPLIVYANKDLKFGFPHTTFTLGASYVLPLDEALGQVTASLNYFHSSKRPDNPPLGTGKGFSRLPAYGLLNATLNWERAMGLPIDLSIFGSNLTNEHYFDGVFSNEDVFGYRTGFPGDPRTYGVNLTYRFGAEGK